MKLQHDTHYLTRSLDVRYVVEDKSSKNFWSKHSLYNPKNINNTKEVSEYGIPYDVFIPIDQDIILSSALCTTRDDKDFILLQNFEFVNYYKDKLVSTVIKSDYDFTFTSDKDSKQGCIRVRGKNLDIHEFPILALITEDSCTIKDKLYNLIRCIQ